MWLAIGWTMLHFLWVGGLIGIVAAVALRAAPRRVGRGPLRGRAGRPGAARPGPRGDRLASESRAAGPSGRCRPEATAAPAMPSAPGPVRMSGGREASPSGRTDRAGRSGGPCQSPASSPACRPGRRGWRRGSTSWRRWLPWLWLIGSPITFAWLALGLAGAERLRRQSAVVTDGELPRLCRRAGRELGIARDGGGRRLRSAGDAGAGGRRPTVDPAARRGPGRLEPRADRDGPAARAGARASVGQPGQPAPAAGRVGAVLPPGGLDRLGLGEPGAGALLRRGRGVADGPRPRLRRDPAGPGRSRPGSSACAPPLPWPAITWSRGFDRSSIPTRKDTP